MKYLENLKSLTLESLIPQLNDYLSSPFEHQKEENTPKTLQSLESVRDRQAGEQRALLSLIF